MEQRLALPTPAPTVELLRTAAVIGAEVQVELLAGVLGRSIVDTETALQPALDAGVLFSPRDSSEVRFRHALLQEAAYTTLCRASAGATRGGGVRLDRPRPRGHGGRAGPPLRSGRPPRGGAGVARRRLPGGRRVRPGVDALCRTTGGWWSCGPRSTTPSSDAGAAWSMCSWRPPTARWMPETEAGVHYAEQALGPIDPSSDPVRWAEVAVRLSELRWEQGRMDERSSSSSEAEP